LMDWFQKHCAVILLLPLSGAFRLRRFRRNARQQ
jgi:hypothetical protein